MASSTDFALTRNEIIEEGFAKLGKLPIGASLNVDQLARGIRLLNLIIKKESATNIEKKRYLWAMDTDHLVLVPERYQYEVQHGLAANIQRLETALYRDSSGDDTNIDVASLDQYEGIANKNDTGAPTKIRFLRGRVSAEHKVLVNPVPSTVTSGSEVLVNGISYVCIQKHTSDPKNQPSVGTDAHLFWKQAGNADTAWADDTDYENGELIRYAYQKPLFLFDKHSDNPDMPQGWDNFLIYTLALELAPEVDGVDLDTRRWVAARAKQERQDLFPAQREDTQQEQYTNRTEFF
jgi:hypothetical protein